jgi:DtxR family Mn-dependent transcriptional regulator
MNKKKDANPEAVSLAQQNYIEVIDGLVRERGAARTTDLAARLGVSMPSVSEAVRRMVERGFVERKSRHEVVLSKRGRKIAVQLDRRHKALSRFMDRVMAMDPGQSDALACKIEHCVNRDFTTRLLRLAEALERHPEALKDIASRLRGGRAAGRKAP